MGKERIKQRPLLFIHQPNFQSSNDNMQKIFSSKQALKEVDMEDRQLKSEINTPVEIESESMEEIMMTQIEIDNSQPEVDEIQSIIKEYEQKQGKINDEQPTTGQSQVKPHYSFNRVRSFKEMDINEKIIYLKNFPTALPPVSCIFITADQLIRGIFIESTENIVEIKQFDQTRMQLNKDELLEIKMIGY